MFFVIDVLNNKIRKHREFFLSTSSFCLIFIYLSDSLNEWTGLLLVEIENFKVLQNCIVILSFWFNSNLAGKRKLENTWQKFRKAKEQYEEPWVWSTICTSTLLTIWFLIFVILLFFLKKSICISKCEFTVITIYLE